MADPNVPEQDRIVLNARERDMLAGVVFRTENGPRWQDVLDTVEGILTERRLVRFACETHLCGSCAGCKAAKVRDLLTAAQTDRDMYLRAFSEQFDQREEYAVECKRLWAMEERLRLLIEERERHTTEANETSDPLTGTG